MLLLIFKVLVPLIYMVSDKKYYFGMLKNEFGLPILSMQKG